MQRDPYTSSNRPTRAGVAKSTTYVPAQGVGCANQRICPLDQMASGDRCSTKIRTSWTQNAAVITEIITNATCTTTKKRNHYYQKLRLKTYLHNCFTLKYSYVTLEGKQAQTTFLDDARDQCSYAPVLLFVNSANLPRLRNMGKYPKSFSLFLVSNLPRFNEENHSLQK